MKSDLENLISNYPELWAAWENLADWERRIFISQLEELVKEAAEQKAAELIE